MPRKPGPTVQPPASVEVPNGTNFVLWVFTVPTDGLGYDALSSRVFTWYDQLPDDVRDRSRAIVLEGVTLDALNDEQLATIGLQRIPDPDPGPDPEPDPDPTPPDEPPADDPPVEP